MYQSRFRIGTIYCIVWRTSTPEPTADGIIWTALKDVTKYTTLFANKGCAHLPTDNTPLTKRLARVLLLDLGNLVDAGQGLTGEYDGKCFVSGQLTPDIMIVSNIDGSVFRREFQVPICSYPRCHPSSLE